MEDSMAMKRLHDSPEQIIRLLAEGETLLGQGQPVEDVARHLEISEFTWHRWQNKYGGMKADDLKELRDLRKQNQRLKKIVADQALDIDMLKEVARDAPIDCQVVMAR
jgi:putative transposase